MVKANAAAPEVSFKVLPVAWHDPRIVPFGNTIHRELGQFEVDRSQHWGGFVPLLQQAKEILVAESYAGVHANLLGALILAHNASAAVATITFLGVRREHRRRGVATALLNAAQSTAEGWKAGAMELRVAHANEAARSLYERLGWQAASLQMRRSIDH